jgi:filamentous hemagglutinin
MTLGEIVSRIVVDSRKLTAYALDSDNPLGRHKALVFERRLGLTISHVASLQQQIETLAPKAQAALQRSDQYGQHYRVDIQVTGTNEQRAAVRTGWVVPPGSDTAHLVTCYVLRKT